MPAPPMRVAVLWPKPRAARWRLGSTDPDQYPDLSDALLYLRHEGVDVVIEESLRGILNPLSGMHEFYSGLDPLRAVRVIMRRLRYDAAICVGDATAYFPIRLRQTLGFKLPIVLIDPALSHNYPRRKRLQDVVIPRADHIVVLGRAQQAYIRHEYGNVPVSVLPNRVDTDFYCPAPSDYRTGEEAYVFSIGNDLSRDYATLVRAAEICAQHPAFRARFLVHTALPVAGVPANLHVDRRQISYTDLRERYRRAAAVVIPLTDAIHPGGITSILEAMATGSSLIVSRSEGVDEYLDDGKTALVVPPGDAAAMGDAILRLTSDPALAARLGSAARAFVVEHCANQVYARRLAAILRRLCAGAGTATRTK